MKTDIIILTAGKEKLIEKCLDSIEKYSDLQLIGKVVIGCTTDDSLDLVSESAGKRKLSIEAQRMEYNFAKCCNALAKQCSSEALLFMNDDVELTEDAITPCLNALQKFDNVGTVGICLRFPDGTIQHGGIFVHWQNFRIVGLGHIGMKSDAKLPDIYTFGNTGAFMMIRKADFDAVGGFSEKYECCFEDVELNASMTSVLHKYNVTLNTVNAIHRESTTRKQAFGKNDSALLQSFLQKNALALTKFSLPMSFSEGSSEWMQKTWKKQ